MLMVTVIVMVMPMQKQVHLPILILMPVQHAEQHAIEVGSTCAT